MRRAAIGLVLLVCGAVAPAAAQYVEPNLTFFDTLVTRHPVIERELEIKLHYTKERDADDIETTAALEFPILPRLQLEIEVPFLVRNPEEGKAVAGFGDLELQAKLQVFKSVQYRTLVAFGLESTLASGSRSRDLGGEYALEPFLTAGRALGPFDLIGEVAYEWILNGDEHPREQAFTARLALAYPVSRRFIPLLELVTVTQTRGPAKDEEGLRHKMQVYVVPGVNIRPRPGVTVRAGFQIPVTTAKAFEYQWRSALAVEF
jgi:hypothetical protein